MKFEVGDRVRIVLANAAPHLIGAECTIIAYHEVLGGLYETDITHPNGRYWCGKAYCFRKIGDDPVSWSEIEKLTNWNPTRVEA